MSKTLLKIFVLNTMMRLILPQNPQNKLKKHLLVYNFPLIYQNLPIIFIVFKNFSEIFSSILSFLFHVSCWAHTCNMETANYIAVGFIANKRFIFYPEFISSTTKFTSQIWRKKNENNQLCLSNNAGFLTNQQPICCQLNANYLPLISDAVMAKTFDAQTQSFIVIENHRNTNQS